MSSCRWNGAENPRLLRTHERDCIASGCEGCVECPDQHCATCGMRHVEGADIHCPNCVGDVRTNLDQAETLEDHLLTEAMHRGVNSEAMVLLGPAADYKGWKAVRAAHIDRAYCECDNCPSLKEKPDWKPCPSVLAFTDDNRDEPVPTWVVGSWAMLVGEHLGHDQTLKITTSSAVHYLKANLTDLARDPEFPFDELAREIRQCVGHLEDVLHDGERDDKGAPCPMCGKGALVKDHGTTIEADRWRCPKCKAAYTEHDYRLKVEAVYVLKADRLTASQIHETYRVAEGTVRRWASGREPSVRVRGKDEQGRQLYDVSDVLAARDKRAS